MFKAILGLTALFLAASVPAVCAQDVSPAVLVPPAPAAVVVDGKGRKVGAYFPVVSYGVGTLDLQTNDNVLIQAGTSSGLWFLLPISKQGFIPTGTTTGAGFPPLYYTTADCSGTAYMKPSPGGLTVSSASYGVAGGLLYYAAPGPTKRITSPSIKYVDPNGKGFCQASGSHSLPPPILNASPAVTFNLSSLGFVAPFKISSLMVLQ